MGRSSPGVPTVNKAVNKARRRVLCALLAGSGLLATPALAQANVPSSTHRAPDPAGSWRFDLTSTTTDQTNISHNTRGITIKDPALRTRSMPGSSFAMYTTPSRPLGGQFSAFTVERTATIPAHAQLLVEVRGRNSLTDWTEWRAVDHLGRAVLPKPVSVIQVRVTLVRAEQVGPGTAPSVSDVVVRADREQPAPAPGPSGPGAPAATNTYRIWATREGLVGGTTANGHIVQERDHFVALPSRRLLSSGGTQYQVQVCYKSRCETAPVMDVGPWNTHDDYWNPGSLRETWTDLPQGTPEAQAAYSDGYNGGKDEFGRTVVNPAGIDLADGTFWDGLGMTDNDWVEVTFQATTTSVEPRPLPGPAADRPAGRPAAGKKTTAKAASGAKATAAGGAKATAASGAKAKTGGGAKATASGRK
jgi:hypothetical protein